MTGEPGTVPLTSFETPAPWNVAGDELAEVLPGRPAPGLQGDGSAVTALAGIARHDACFRNGAVHCPAAQHEHRARNPRIDGADARSHAVAVDGVRAHAAIAVPEHDDGFDPGRRRAAAGKSAPAGEPVVDIGGDGDRDDRGDRDRRPGHRRVPPHVPVRLRRGGPR